MQESFRLCSRWQSLRWGLPGEGCSWALAPHPSSITGPNCHCLYLLFLALTVCLNYLFSLDWDEIHPLKYIVQPFLVYSQGCKTITTITFSLPPKETPHLLAVSTHSFCPGHHCLSLWVTYAGHFMWVIQQVAFGVSIHLPSSAMLQCASVSHYFLCLCDIPLHKYQLLLFTLLFFWIACVFLKGL